MYIWILLATIMISLSFLNLSPRADKEGVFTEVKATSLVNRFKIEHSAFSRLAECRLINSTSASQTIAKYTGADGDNSFMQNELPIGYIGGEDLHTYHYTYCLTDDVTDGGSPEIAGNCLITDATPVFRYSVSYARIPDRWIAKDTGAPVATLSNALAKIYVKGSILGIARCSVAESGSAVDSCTFQGSEAYIRENSQDPESGQNSGASRAFFLSFKGTTGGTNDFYHKLFAEQDFRDSCGGACLFAIRKLSNVNRDKHCTPL